MKIKTKWKFFCVKVEIKHLEKDNSERKIIEESIQTTKGPTHSNYSMEIMDVFKLHKQHEHDEVSILISVMV